MLNLKGVVFRLHNRDEVTARARQGGRRPGDGERHPEPNHDVEIVNPDHVIAHRRSGGKLEMEIKVEKGRLPARDDAPLRRRPTDRQHRARRVVLAGRARELCGRERARRAAHRPRQAGDGHRHQRHHQLEEAAPVGQACLVEQLGVRAADLSRTGGRPAVPRLAVRPDPAAPGSTTWSSR